MGRRTVLALVLMLAGGLASAAPTVAVCPSVVGWPAFTDIAEEARRVVIGTVSEVEDGVATRLQVEEVLRGESRRQLDLTILQARLGEEKADCAYTGLVAAEVGDRLAIAFNGKADAWPRNLDSAALLDAPDDHPNASGLQRLTTPQTRLLLGHESDGSTVALPGHPPVEQSVSLLERLLRFLPGGFLGVFDETAGG